MHSQMRGLFTLSQRPSRRGLAPPAGSILAPWAVRRLPDFHANMARRNLYEVQVAAERSKRGLSVWRDEGAAHEFAMLREWPASAAGGLWAVGACVRVRVVGGCLSRSLIERCGVFVLFRLLRFSVGLPWWRGSQAAACVSSGRVRFGVGNVRWCLLCPRAITVCVCVLRGSLG